MLAIKSITITITITITKFWKKNYNFSKINKNLTRKFQNKSSSTHKNWKVQNCYCKSMNKQYYSFINNKRYIKIRKGELLCKYRHRNHWRKFGKFHQRRPQCWRPLRVLGSVDENNFNKVIANLNIEQPELVFMVQSSGRFYWSQ